MEELISNFFFNFDNLYGEIILPSYLFYSLIDRMDIYD